MPQHCDPDVLDQAALGTLPLSPADQEHLAGCEECAETLTALGQVVATARGAAGMQLEAPPNSVWQGISAQIADTGVDSASVVPLPTQASSRRSRRRWAALAAAAAVGAIVGGVLSGVIVTDRQPGTPGSQVVATADLVPLPGHPADPKAAGSAVLKNVSGADVLALETTGLPATGGYYEVWLMDPRTAGLISIGTVPAGDHQTSISLPAGVRLDQYSVVDISDEPMDGNPAHSSVSVLRGKLTA
jgi:hypothetical protein